MRTLKNITTISVLAMTGLTVLLAGNAAQAFPAYSQKEKKPCMYCHVKPSGGGKRNAAGMWYKTHGLSFAGYKPEKAKPAPSAKVAPKKPAKPAAPKKPPTNKKG